MTEQEKKSGGSSAGGSSVVMVEQSAASRHKQPYRPTDLQEDAPELHHKRSKAPAVPSVTEELKDSTENQIPETKERKECERAMSSEKHKHNAAKKLSPNTMRRDSSPETIALAPVEVEKKVETKKGTTSPQPIPAHLGPSSSTALKVVEQEKVEAEKKGDDDSITEEIAELRTPEVVNKESEWDGDKNSDDLKCQDIASDVATPSKSTSESMNDNKGEDIHFPGSLPAPSTLCKLTPATDSNLLKKKEITWYDGSYLPKENNIQELGSRSKAWMLERKVSVGPCFGAGAPFGEPSGITICVPKKSIRSMNDSKPSQSGICISVSRKYLDKPTKSGIDFVRKSCGDRVKVPSKGNNRELKIDEVPVKLLGNLKGKLDNMYGKIKTVLHIQ